MKKQGQTAKQIKLEIKKHEKKAVARDGDLAYQRKPFALLR
jgi:hypothetical protein